MRTFIVFASLLALAAAAPQGYGYNTQNEGVQQHHRGGDKYLPPATTTPAPIVHKQFFVIGAEEDHDSIERSKHLIIGRPQKNYRVVFIKAPNSGLGNVKLSAQFAPQEEKTVIYVLTKKDNELNVNDIATPAPTLPAKPEVYFIKYKTPEEALSAQKEIQTQYDRLGGTNEYLDEGTAPVTSVIGSLDGGTPDGGYDYQQIRGGESSPLTNYLPPVRRI